MPGEVATAEVDRPVSVRFEGESNNMTLKHACPMCKAAVSLGDDNPARPFCSERCQGEDLRRWLDDVYVIHEPLPNAGVPDEEDDG